MSVVLAGANARQLKLTNDLEQRGVLARSLLPLHSWQG